MNPDKIKKIARIPAKKKEFREREHYRRIFWGTVFLEILLQKIKEKEFLEVGEVYHPRELQLEVNSTATEETAQTGSGSRSWYQDVRIILENTIVWASGDVLQLSIPAFALPQISEDYSPFMAAVQNLRIISQNEWFAESCDILKRYYQGCAAKMEVGLFFLSMCRMSIENQQEAGGDIRQILVRLYEYFARANAQNAVEKNNEEGKKIAKAGGLSWAGCSYYNAVCYYQYKEIAELLQENCSRAATEFGILQISYAQVEEETRFRWSGGITYHSVWVWAQMQNNYPCDGYGLRDETLEPPVNFMYFYRDYFSEGQYGAVTSIEHEMEARMQESAESKGQCWSYTVAGGNDYHNGLSYFFDEKKPESDWKGKMDFLANFKLYRTAGCLEVLMR